MADIPHGPKFPEQCARAVTLDFSAAMLRRDQRRAELARQAAKVHYLDTPPKPR